MYHYYRVLLIYASNPAVLLERPRTRTHKLENTGTLNQNIIVLVMSTSKKGSAKFKKKKKKVGR